MFIREFKTKNKKTGTVYTTHKLVESIRTEHGPRQRIIMSLGTLAIPRVDWKRLAHALECRLRGQASLLEAEDQDIERLALSLVSSNKLSKRLAEDDPKTAVEEDKREIVSIDLNSVQTKETRSIGAETLCLKAWDLLGLTEILKALKFTPKAIAAAMALVFGRLISPGSERHTIEWFRKRSALSEFPGMDILSSSGKDLFYEIGDELYACKDHLERMLYRRDRELFPHTETTVFLYDITNTYFEGNAIGNTLAARGHCKSKRFDCPLITLSLVVDNTGMPILSQIYKGNQSEPETLEGVLTRLSQQIDGAQVSLCKAIIVMDRDIATAENIAWLSSNGYHYVVVKREESCEAYREQFEEDHTAFERIGGRKSIYGDENNAYIRKELISAGLCRVLCISEGRARKETAIAASKERPFLESIENFRQSIKKGTIKNQVKIEAKLKRLVGKYARIAAGYEVSLEVHEGKAQGIFLRKKEAARAELFGCYVIETSHADYSAVDIWRLYMTLSKVESAFRSMKEALGVRPVYHQTGDRSAAHLFISVLAYHLLATMEQHLTSAGDTRTWATIRQTMSTLTRSTVMMRDEAGATYHIRTTGQPEAEHQDIFDKLDTQPSLKTIISKIA